MADVVDAVLSVLSACMEHSGNDDVSYVDMTPLSLISASSQVGILLDEILVTRTRQVVEEVLSSLRQLHLCLNQLCLEYETKLFVMISGRSPPVSTTVTREGRRRRPKKTILPWYDLIGNRCMHHKIVYILYITNHGPLYVHSV